MTRTRVSCVRVFVAKHFLTSLTALNSFVLQLYYLTCKMFSQTKFNIKLTFGFVRQLCGFTTFYVSFSLCPAYLIPENTEGRGVGKTNNLVSPQTFMRYINVVENSTTYIGFHTRRAVMRARSILGIILCIDLTLFQSAWSARRAKLGGVLEGVRGNRVTGFPARSIPIYKLNLIFIHYYIYVCLYIYAPLGGTSMAIEALNKVKNVK